MTDHVRLQALKRLCELITNETGYKVYRGRQVVGKDIPTPFLVITETIRSGDTQTTAEGVHRVDRVDFLLSGYIENGSVSHPIDVAYEAVAKIEAALNLVNALESRTGKPVKPEYYKLGGAVSKFQYMSPVCHNPPDDIHAQSYFYIYFSFHIAYNGLNPCAKINPRIC